MRFVQFIPMLLFTISSVFAQYSPNDILLSIGNQKVTADEFLQTYIKNNQAESPSGETVENYFELYTKFKLKVAAAFDAKLDTLTSFKTEFAGYRNQLAKSYLTDTETLNKLIKEAYFRTSTEVNASHFMIALSENAVPSDTLAAYNRIMAVHKRLDKESFEQLAQELSDDPSAKTNKGNLGYFKAFRLPYTLESAAYATPIGQISRPVRTRFGYHIVKVNNKRTSAGDVKVAHIMVAAPVSATDSLKKEAERKINTIYKELNSGKSFDTLAINLSDDRYSARNGGELPWFGAGEMVPEFEDAAFALNHNGQVSKPIQTNFGWHIIRLLEKKPIPAFETIQNDLKTKVLQSDRAAVIEKSFVTKLKKENKWTVNRKNLSTFYMADGLVGKSSDNPVILLNIENKTYTSADFAKYLALHNKPTAKEQLKPFIDGQFNEFVDKTMIDYENQHLEAKNTEFSQTVHEYFEGLLLFEIMEREVWSKASKDSAGLENYFASQKEKYNNPTPQNLEDIRGLVISDYQQFLEDKWIAELKKKYIVTVNTKLLNKIASKYKTSKL